MFTSDFFTIVAINFTQYFFQFSIITMLYRYKVHWLKTLAVSLFLAFFLFENPFLFMGVYFLGSALYYYKFAEIRYHENFLAVSTQFFLSILVNNVFLITHFTLTPEINMIYIRLAVTFSYFIFLMLVKFTKFTTVNLINNKIISILSITLMLVALSSVAINDILFDYEMVRSALILNAIAVLTIQFTTLYIAYVLNKFVVEIENAELQNQYTKTLENSLDEWEGYQHDFRNIVNSLNGFRLAEDYKGLSAYISSLDSSLHNEKNIIEINRNLKDNMPYLYGIALAKAGFSMQNEIKFRVRVTAQVFNLKTLSEVQLSKMVGNLLDNAMEHAYLSDEKLVTMEISNFHREKIRIVISNSVNEKVDTLNIFKRGVSHKKGHTGFGLYEVKKIVDNRIADGMYVDFNITCTDRKFTADLLV